MSTLKLTYFDAPGRAEPVRIAFHMGGVAYEDHRLKFPEYSEARARGDYPLNAVPVLEVDGQRVVQTAAMLRYAARVGDSSLYPADPHAALVVDSALDCLNDTLSHALTPSLFERDPEKKLAMRAEIAAGPLTRVLGYIEGLLEASGGPYVTGATLSIADIVIALQVQQIRSGRLDGWTEALLEPYPRVLALTAAYLADVRVEAYAAK